MPLQSVTSGVRMFFRLAKLFLFAVTLSILFQNCGSKYSGEFLDVSSTVQADDLQMQGDSNKEQQEGSVANTLEMPVVAEDLAMMRVSGFYGPPGSPTAYGVVVDDQGRVFKFEERATLDPASRILMATLSAENLKVFQERTFAAITEETTESSLGLPCMMDGGTTYFSVMPTSKSVKTIATEGGCEKTVVLPGVKGQDIVRQLKALAQLRF